MALPEKVDTTKIPLHTEGNFWEHLAEHLVMSFAFTILGMLLSHVIWFRLFKNKFKVDYNLEKGTIIRIFPNGRKWLICHPSSLMEWIDIALLCYIDRGKDDYVSQHSKRKIRLISICLVVTVIFMGLTGVTLVLSAFEKDMNPLNYIF